jgi:hypothetical protein
MIPFLRKLEPFFAHVFDSPERLQPYEKELNNLFPDINPTRYFCLD